jgi:hypothetical protein
MRLRTFAAGFIGALAGMTVLAAFAFALTPGHGPTVPPKTAVCGAYGTWYAAPTDANLTALSNTVAATAYMPNVSDDATALVADTTYSAVPAVVESDEYLLSIACQ